MRSRKIFLFFFFSRNSRKRKETRSTTRRGIVGNHVGDRRSIVRPVAVSKPRGSRFKERDQPLAGGGRRRKREWLGLRFFLLSRSCRFDDRRRTSAIDDSDDSRRKSVWIVATSRGTHVVSASSRFRSNGHDNGARDVHIRALPPHVLLFIRRSIYNIPSLLFSSFYPPL